MSLGRKFSPLSALPLAPLVVVFVLQVDAARAQTRFGVPLASAVAAGAAIAFTLWAWFAVTRRFAHDITRLHDLSVSVARMQETLVRQDAERTRAEEVIARLSGGLDAASTNIMIADASNTIIHMNESATRLFKGIEKDLRRELPNLDAANMIGKNIDVFHKNPAHQHKMLAALDRPVFSQFVVGGRTMRFCATPIRSPKGVRTGTVVEWIDRTEEMENERDIQKLVTAVVGGDLQARVKEEGAPTYVIIAKGLNTLVECVGDIVAEVDRLVAAADGGDLSQRIGFEGKVGLNRRAGQGINTLVESVADVVEEVQRLVGAANQGDLTSRIAVEGRSGLFQRVGGGVNDLVANMAQVISQVKVAAGEVNRGADEISQGNINLSQRTEEQASSLEETASSMEQMTSTVKQNAESAGQANQLAVAARDQAEKGGAVVARAVEAMTGINESSRRIADIIGVIDAIAFQTNLLALNAAVEAARAGEQGRGFAVVAAEVRNLAGRSATAAKEIKALIQDSVGRVEEGSALVSRSGATLEHIVAAVKKVTDIVAEITAASHEQSVGIEQVNKAVMQLDELTQQNAALVEQASAASQSMADQARALNQAMSRYRVVDTLPAGQGRPAPVGRGPETVQVRRRAC
jgi:methyl-accepting chemotaxis protein